MLQVTKSIYKIPAFPWRVSQSASKLLVTFVAVMDPYCHFILLVVCVSQLFVNFCVPAKVPNPTNLRVELQSSSVQLKVWWDAPGDTTHVEKYRLEKAEKSGRGDQLSAWGLVTETTNPATTSHTVGSLEKGKFYSFRIRSVKKPSSTGVEVQTDWLQLPRAIMQGAMTDQATNPTSFSVKGITGDSITVVITEDKTNRADTGGYEIMYVETDGESATTAKTGATVEYADVAVGSDTTVENTISGLKEETFYLIRVKSRAGTTKIDHLLQINITGGGNPKTLLKVNAPTTVSANNMTTDSMRVEWTGECLDDCKGFRVEVQELDGSDQPTGEMKAHFVKKTDDKSQEITGLTQETKYRMRVRAMVADSVSSTKANSDWKEGKTTLPAPPAGSTAATYATSDESPTATDDAKSPNATAGAKSSTAPTDSVSPTDTDGAKPPTTTVAGAPPDSRVRITFWIAALGSGFALWFSSVF